MSINYLHSSIKERRCALILPQAQLRKSYLLAKGYFRSRWGVKSLRVVDRGSVKRERLIVK